ncbi:MAG TPA: T9SS type A sorting domain-containing protein [Bacteroidia bacterium]|jgi:hypothetical protein
MKKFIVVCFIAFSFFGKAQNSFDPYDVCNPTDVSAYLDNFDSYTGEYQIFLKEGTVPHHWTSAALQNNAISYKVELVSFPFTTNCVNCYGTGAVNATDRILKMPNNITYPYDPAENAWIRSGSAFPTPPAGTTYEVRLLNKYEGEYGIVGDYSDPSSLISIHLIGELSVQYIEPNRKIYPHSVLKHTLYMHCSNDVSTPKVDSFSFIFDHTRGRMRNYPFCATNDISAGNRQYDIGMVPSIIDGSYQPSYGSSGLTDIIDYYPHYPYDNICPEHIPENLTTANPQHYIRPAPYSQVQAVLSNAQTDNAAGLEGDGTPLDGLPHQYVIDRPVDLTVINPSEKIIYNPSEVSIDLNLTGAGQALVFPSGYTFKTVSGIYPTQAAVAAADPYDLYHHDADVPVTTTLACDDVGANDNVFSYYYVKSGSTLNIMPCVAIYDTKIIVQAGAFLNYNVNSVRGNFIVQSAGGTINSSYTFPAPATCRFDCFDKLKYDDRLGNIHISSSQSWSSAPGGIPSAVDTDNDGIVRISGTLIIDPGVILTVNPGVRFEFGENGKMVISRQSKLQVNGNAANPVIFTSVDFCELGMWEGIEVWGKRNEKQGVIALSPQGIAKINYAKISNARTALATRKDHDASYNGGIIQCQNVEFLNNAVSAEFLSYHNTFPPAINEIKNLSYFKSCRFLVTGYLNDKTYRLGDGRRLGTTNQLVFKDVNTVFVENCLFENNALQSDGITPLFESDNRGTAIYSLDAGVFLTGGPKKNIFRGFSDGVWALSTGINNCMVSITGNVFENNTNGVVLEGTRLSRLLQNEFKVPAHTTNVYALPPSYNAGYNKPVGLYLIGAMDFRTEENIFSNYGPVSTDGIPVQEYNYGMVVNNCAGPWGDGTGNAYKNTFANANVGLQAELDNKGGFSYSGLQYKCNEFNSRISYDVVVPAYNGFLPPVNTLLRSQGLCNQPGNQAGNIYTPCSASQDVQLKFDFQSEFDNFDFIYRDQAGKISCASNPSFVVPCPANDDNSCPSNLNICYTIACLLTTHTTASAQALSSSNSYNSLLDGGNTAALLEQINSNIPEGALKQSLMDKSPYLSDEVLLAMLNRSNPMAPGHIQQITLANSPLTKPVMTAVQEEGLPEGIFNRIAAAQTGVSPRMEKENEVSYYAFQEKLAEVNVKQAYLEMDNLDSLKIVALKDTTLAGLFKLMEVLLAKGDLAAAQLCRSKIISKEIPHISDQCRFLSTRLNLALEGKTWFDMSSAQASLIEQIYLNNPLTAINARAVLSMTKGLKYERYPFDLQFNHTMLPHDPISNIQQEELSKLKVFPNPAADILTIEIKLQENENAELCIYNLLGDEISKRVVTGSNLLTLDISEYSNGIYMCILKSQSGEAQKRKIIISK